MNKRILNKFRKDWNRYLIEEFEFTKKEAKLRKNWSPIYPDKKPSESEYCWKFYNWLVKTRRLIPKSEKR